MKKLNLKILRDIRSQKAQFIALILVVLLGMASFTGTLFAYRNLRTSLDYTYDHLKFADVSFAFQGAPEDLVRQVADVPNVAAAQGRLILDTGLWLGEGKQVRARLIGVPLDQRSDVNDVHLTRGRYLQPGSVHSTLLERHFADYYSYEPGTILRAIIGQLPVAFEVVGVVDSPEYLYPVSGGQDLVPSARTFAVLLVPLDDLQQLTGQQKQINEISILVENQDSLEDTRREIESVLEPYGLQKVTLRDKQPSNVLLKLDVDGFQELAWFFPTFILGIAAFAVYIILNRLVRAQRPQIGLFRALGYNTRQIMTHYLFFAVFIALVGSLFGIILGYWLSGLIARVYTNALGIPFLQTGFYPGYLAIGILLSLAFCLVGAAFPARAAIRLVPATAMRLDPVTTARGSWTFRISPLLRRWVSLPLRLALRNVFRARLRTLSTVISLIFVFILIISSWSFFDTFDYALNLQYEQIDRWDLMTFFLQPQTDATWRRIEQWEETQQVERAFQQPGLVSANGQQQETIIVGLDPTAELHRLDLSSDSQVNNALREGEVVLTSSLLDKLGIQIGDQVTVETNWDQDTFTVIGASPEITGMAAYIPLTGIWSLADALSGTFNTLFIIARPGDVTQVRSKLYQTSGVASVQLKQDIIRDWQSLMSLYNAFTGVMLFFALAMGFAVIFNTSMVNVLEQQREIATMRAIGQPRSHTILMISMESILLWLMALVPGLLLGNLAAAGMLESLNTELFSLQSKIYMASYGIIAVGVLVIVLLSAVPAIRYVIRLNLAEATKVLT